MTKTILITGAGTGLGKGTALGLAKKGHKVIAGVEIWPQVSALLEEATQKNINLEVIKLDMKSEIDRKNAYKYEIDILVNNAGIGESGPIAEIPMELVRNVFEVNVFCALEFTQCFAKKFVAKGKGKIVFVSSMAGVSTYPFVGAYDASKHALEAIAQCMKDELKEFGVQVCTINPGPYRTGFNDRLFDSLNQWYDSASNFTKEQSIKDMQELTAKDESQFEPQEMIDLMVETIQAEHHKFRTMLPEAVTEWCLDYQKRMWEEEI
ncbi:MAG: SDR family oxidoreductase [Methylococcaceae bacterium]|nr:SDR family oxidoreductase [Methylococcaceae bacterium]